MYQTRARPAFSPARNKGQRIFWKHMHNERSLDALLLRRSKNLQRIYSGGDQAIALNRDPLARVRGSVLIDPIHFLRAITGRQDHLRRSIALQSISEA